MPVIGIGASSCGRSPDSTWNPQAPGFLPSGVELSRFLADEADFPSEEEKDQLAEVASYYEAFQSRATLRERLRQIPGAQATENASKTCPLMMQRPGSANCWTLRGANRW